MDDDLEVKETVWQDMWQEPIAVMAPVGEFVPPGGSALPPPALLEHIVLFDPEEDYVGDHFVAEYLGPRGAHHPIGNLLVRRKNRDVYKRWAAWMADIEVSR